MTWEPTEEDVERGAEALCESLPPPASGATWPLMPEWTRELLRQRARAVLASAPPIIERERRAAQVEAWDEGLSAAWYKALPYHDYRDASEADAPNPYEIEAGQ